MGFSSLTCPQWWGLRFGKASGQTLPSTEEGSRSDGDGRLVRGAGGAVALEAGRLGSGRSLSLTRSVTLGVSLNLSAPYFPVMAKWTS